MNATGTLNRPHTSPLDRAAHAVGSALVAWSQRAPREARTAEVDRETLQLRRAAALELEQITARRDLGINQLLR